MEIEYLTTREQMALQTPFPFWLERKPLWRGHVMISVKTFSSQIKTESFSFMISNLWHSNIVDISGALFMLRIQYEYTQIKFDEGARDVNNIWFPEITYFRHAIIWTD